MEQSDLRGGARDAPRRHALILTVARHGPLATLGEALERARRARQREVTIRLTGGVHRIDETVVIRADSAVESLVIEARAGERPILSSGMPVGGWEPAESGTGLPEATRERVWSADVRQVLDAISRTGRRRFLTVYDAQGMLQRARSPERKTADDGSEAGGAGPRTLRFAPGELRRWPNLANAEIHIQPHWRFVGMLLPLADVDETQGTATTAAAGPCALTTQGRLAGDESLYWVENALEYLNGPGQWALDSRAGRIYVWPRDGDGPPRGVVVPQLTELVRVEGTRDRPVRGVTLRGLTFSHADRLAPSDDLLPLQHHWDFFDAPNAALRLRNAESVTIEDCVFEECGGAGLRLDLNAQRIGVRGNEFRNLGAHGVVVCGYGPGTLDVSRDNTIAANHVHHCGRLVPHSSAILLWQSGHNRIADNVVHDMPYCGITLIGVRATRFRRAAADHNEGAATIRWHEIPETLPPWGDRAWDEEDWAPLLPYLHGRNNVFERNEVHHVMQRLADGNGIYLSGGALGNVVRRNYVHHIEGRGANAAIRTDDFQSGTRIEQNVVWQINGGGITLKHVNDVLNNVIVACRRGGYVMIRRGPSFGARVERNVMLRPGGEVPFHTAGGMFGGRLEEPDIDRNTYWCDGDPDAAARALDAMRTLGKEAHGVAADPHFVDWRAGDFRLRPGSPAPEVGFEPIDSWGPRVRVSEIRGSLLAMVTPDQTWMRLRR